MLACQRDLFDMPRDICFLNAAAWSPIPLEAVRIGKAAAERKSRPWELAAGFDQDQFERARRAAAQLINADIDDVALTSSVGYGVSTAAKIFDVPPNTRVLVLANDHTAPTLEWMSRAGDAQFEVEVVEPGPKHDWTAQLLDAISRPGARPVALASISSVHWSDGGIIDIDQVQTALKRIGAALLIDATHAVGVIDTDVKRLDPDFVVFPTYKWLLGPYGRAFLYVAKRHQHGIPLEQTSYGRKRVKAEDATYFTDLSYVDNARRFDMGERDFFVSLEMASHGMELLADWTPEHVQERLTTLTDHIAGAVADMEVSIIDRQLRAPHIVSLGFPGGMPSDLGAKLTANRVYAAPRLGRLRISPHVYNDETDCERLAMVLREALR